jgi:hypothetical protein
MDHSRSVIPKPLGLNTMYLDYDQLLSGNLVVDNKIFNQVWAMYHFQTERPVWEH